MSIEVLIRTMARPSLGRAVASVLAQVNAPPFRVLIQPAHGEVLDPGVLGPWAADERVVLLPPTGHLARAQAANRLLNHAQAEWLLFLDDDDWLLPEHLASLEARLRDAPEAVAAFSGARIVQAADGAEVGVLQADQLDLTRLLLANRLAIHAVLFRRAVVAAPPSLRFDEGLACFEDWDFWCQLAARGALAATGGMTAVYCLDAQAGSGHAAAGPQRASALQALGHRQLSRLTPQLYAECVEGWAALEAERARIHGLLGQRITDNEALLETQAALLTEAKALREEQCAQTSRITAYQVELGRLEAVRQTLLADLQVLEATQLALAHAEGQRAEWQARFEVTRQELTMLEGVRLALLADVDVLNRRVADLLASTSWRVTAPLRRAITTARQARGVAARAVAPLRVGLPNLLRTVRQQWRHHGAWGFVRRVPLYVRRLPSRWRWLASPAAAAVAGNPFDQAARVRRQGERRPLSPDLSPRFEPLAATVSVVIPVLNGGAELQALIRKLLSQQGLAAVEVVIVDSGSRDGSAPAARALGAKVVEILPSEFSHSHSRNVGADAATGEFLLFMVQDAFPIGQRWIAGLVQSLARLQPQGVVAVSCAETPRSDSDMMYDSMVHTHYRFLGCDVKDRVGRFTGDDHMSLRSQGQLSDVACMIPRALFQQYRYRGDYAEDLDLGMRLIRDGHRIAMLSSLRVIHSHNRPPYYYLKRSLVDVVFLVDLFADFHHPRIQSLRAQVGEVVACSRLVSEFLAAVPERALGQPTAGWVRALVEALRQPLPSGGAVALGDARLDGFVARLVSELPPGVSAAPEEEPFSRSLAARLEHFEGYFCEVYDAVSAPVREELAAALVKIFAQALGTLMAYAWLDRRERPPADEERQWAAAVFAELKAGV